MALWVVRPGEHLESIASRLGSTPEAIWGASGNADLRASRGTGAILRAGDVLVVPDPPPPREAALRIGDTNTFRANVPTTTVSIRFTDGDRALAGEPFRVEAEGRTIRGTSDGEGTARFVVRVGTRRAHLVLERRHTAFDLDVGGLDPATTASGAQMRLRHLGYYRGELDGVLAGATAEALRAFQSASGLGPSGLLDETTTSALVRAHGS